MKKFRFLLAVVIIAALAFFISQKPLQKFLCPVKYEEQVERASEEFGVSQELIFSVIKTESSFRPNAVSHMDAKGLMQITRDTFNWANEKLGENHSYEEVFLPDVNIRYGTFILSYLIEDFKSEPVALAAYNAGRGNVQKWLADKEFSHDGETLHHIPFKETREYVVKVEKSKDAYLKLYPDRF